MQMICCVFVLTILASLSAPAQETLSDRQLALESRKALIESYKNFVGVNSRLYNGIDRTRYEQEIKGTAFFMADSMVNGSVTYDSIYFENVPMEFDLYKQELVISHFEKFRFSLLPEKTTSFEFAGHHFVRHDKQPRNTNAVPPGFYDHLYNGPSAIIVRRTKLLDQKVTDVIEREFIPDNYYYVKRGDGFVSCNNSRQLFRIIGNRTRDVKRHLRRQKIKFKKNFENAMLESLRFYDNQH